VFFTLCFQSGVLCFGLNKWELRLANGGFFIRRREKIRKESEKNWGGTKSVRFSSSGLGSIIGTKGVFSLYFSF